jgi:molybdenum cofactor cytidylyltransferase
LPGAVDGVLLMLADQASVTADDLRRLAGAWRRQPDSILAAQYSGVTGVPAIFPRWAFHDLAQLRGDRGAQLLLQRYADRVARLRMVSAAIDIDRPEDLLAVETGVDRRPPPPQ